MKEQVEPWQKNGAILNLSPDLGLRSLPIPEFRCLRVSVEASIPAPLICDGRETPKLICPHGTLSCGLDEEDDDDWMLAWPPSSSLALKIFLCQPCNCFDCHAKKHS